jgi:type I restriction enzyme M protein
VTRNKENHGKRKRNGEILFIDARNMGTMVDIRHRELTKEDIKKNSDTYHAWRGEKQAGKYEDTKGFCNPQKQTKLRKIILFSRLDAMSEFKIKKMTASLLKKMKRLTEEFLVNLKKVKN